MRRMPKIIWLILAVALCIILPFCLFEEAINDWFVTATAVTSQTRTIIGITLFASLALDIFLPVPSSLASTLCGILFGIGGGFLLSFMAMNTSCLLGYCLGRFCSKQATKLIGESELTTLQRFFARYDALILVALRAVPVLAEASVLFAGLVRTPPLKTARLLTFGNAAVSLTYAWIGAYGQTTESMLPAFAGSMLISALLMLTTKLWRKRLPVLKQD